MLFDGSRYGLCEFFKKGAGPVYTGPRPRLFYQDVDGVIPHVCELGDTLWSLAVLYDLVVDGMPAWWAIGDFQPEPILDATLSLAAGDVLYIPPLDLVHAELRQGVDTPLAAQGF